MKRHTFAASIPMIKDVVLGIILSTGVCLFAWLITTAFNPGFIDDVIYSTGDIASNELLVMKAKTFELFSGHYSRMGFYHPGPFFFYVMAAGEVVLYDTLALVGSPVASHVFAIVFLNAFFCYISFSALKSIAGSASAAMLVMILAVASLVVMSGNVKGETENTWEIIDLLSSIWPPYFIVFSSMAVFSLLVSVMAGNAHFIVFLIPSSLVLLHGHASFIFLIPIFTAITVFLWIKRHGPLTPSIAFNYLRSVRPYIAVGLLLGTPLILPILAESRGNLIGWLSQYLFSSSGLRFHSPLGAISYIFQFWNWRLVGWLVLVLPAEFLRWRGSADDCKDLKPASLKATTIVTSAATFLLLFYAVFIIDNLKYHYLGWWYAVIPSLVTGLAFLRVMVVNEVGRKFLLPCGALALLGVAYSALPLKHDEPVELASQIDTTLSAMAITPTGGTAGDRMIPILIARGNHGTFGWPDVVPLIVRMERLGRVTHCIAPPSWHLLFHARHRCGGPHGLMSYTSAVFASRGELPEDFRKVGKIRDTDLNEVQLDKVVREIAWNDPVWRLLTPQLYSGWRPVELDQVCMERKDAVLVLRIPQGEDGRQVALDLRGFTEAGSTQTAEIAVDGGEEITTVFDVANPSAKLVLPLPPGLGSGDHITIRFHVDRLFRAERYVTGKRGTHGLCLRDAKIVK